MIDLGCDPGYRWTDVADAVKRLRDAGVRCSIDTFDVWEAEQATRAGANGLVGEPEQSRGGRRLGL